MEGWRSLRAFGYGLGAGKGSFGFSAARREELHHLMEERSMHEIFIETKKATFVGRGELREKIHAQVEKLLNKGPHASALAVCGEPGRGKSAVMAMVVDHFKQQASDKVAVCFHFAGATPGSSGLEGGTLRSSQNLDFTGMSTISSYNVNKSSSPSAAENDPRAAEAFRPEDPRQVGCSPLPPALWEFYPLA